MNYPKFYLDENIALQDSIDRFHRNVKRSGFQFLGASVLFFVLTLTGITFEIPILTFWGIAENVVCGWYFYGLFDFLNFKT